MLLMIQKPGIKNNKRNQSGIKLIPENVSVRRSNAEE